MTQASTKSVADLYEAAVTHTRKYFAAVKPAQYNDPTPCTDWDVKKLMEHISGGFGFGINTLNAGSLTEADHDAAKGGLTLDAFDKGHKRMQEILKTPGVLDKKVKGPGGEMTGAQFLAGILFTDMLIHGWDLAKATKQSTALPKDLVEAAYAGSSPRFAQMPRGQGKPFQAMVDAPANADTQTKLLAGFGRKA